MISRIVTECPACTTRFQVTDGQVKIANGKVRCGSCLEVFNAELYRCDDLVDPVTTVSIATGKSQHQQFDQFEVPEFIAPQQRSLPQQEQDSVAPAHIENQESTEEPPHTEPRSQDEALIGQPEINTGHDSISTPEIDLEKPVQELYQATLARQTSNIEPAETHQTESIQPESEQAATNLSETIQSVIEQAESNLRGTIYPETEQAETNLRGTTQPETEQAETNLQGTTQPETSTDSNNHTENQASALKATETTKPAFETQNTPINNTLNDTIQDATESTQPSGPAANKANSEQTNEELQLQLQQRSPFTGIQSEPVMINSSRQKPTITFGWSLLSLLTLLLLMAQYAWFERASLRQQPMLTPFYSQLCQKAPCNMPIQSAISLIYTNQLIVQQHPEYQGALNVSILLENLAEFEQPYPAIQLSFSDRKGQLISQRSFQPNEYLIDPAIAPLIMPINRSVQIRMDILDPGRRAISYQAELLPANALTAKQ